MAFNLDQAQLTAALRATATSRQPSQSKLVQQIVSGDASRSLVQAYAAQLWRLASDFSNRLAKTWSICDDLLVRASLLQNLLEEEGVISFQTAKLHIDPARNHGQLAEKFARSLGVVAKPVAKVDDWFDSELRKGAWRSAYAFMAVGYEYNVPAAIQAIYEGLQRHYGLSCDALEFLSLHGEADSRHGEEAIALLVQSCRQSDHAEQALYGARRGTIGFYLMHQLDQYVTDLRPCA